MKCILLAAGYATRLYPLTKERPKSLLPIGNSNILEFIIRKIEQVDAVDQIYIATNERFAEQFQKWVEQYSTTKKIMVLNDGTTTNENRLGAIADLALVIEREKIDEDILVLAGDNLFDFSLEVFVEFFTNVGHDCITANELAAQQALQRTGVVEIDNRQRIISFEEKPQQPKSNLAVPPFYIYQRATLPLIKQYLNEGNNPDAPGNFIPWLLTQKDVYAYRFSGNRYDIGTLESYEEACKLFA